MLIEFTAGNFRSIAEPVTLSMLPATKLSKKHRTGATYEPEVLVHAGIFGPNGSGKSNLIEAIDTYRRLATTLGGKRNGSRLYFFPNLLVDGFTSKPTTFTMSFVVHGVIFCHEISYTQHGVLKERLTSRKPAGRETVLFDRRNDKLEFSPSLSRSSKERELWRRDLQAGQSFLAKAQIHEIPDLKIPRDWVSYRLRTVSNPSDLGGYTVDRLQEDHLRDFATSFISGFGINVEDIILKEASNDPQNSDDFFDYEGRITSKNIKAFTKKRRSNGDYIEFPLKLFESAGTQHLFEMSVPIIESLAGGYTLIVDEIDRSLHTSVLRELIRMFTNEEMNSEGAQLIFASHDTNLLNSGLLMKDQVWLAEMKEFYTDFYSLADFGSDLERQPRASEAFGKQYLSGRFGALPEFDPVRLLKAVERAKP